MDDKKKVWQMDIEELDKELEKELKTPWWRIIFSVVQSLSLVVLIAVLTRGGEMGMTESMVGNVTDAVLIFNIIANFIPLAIEHPKKASRK